MLKNNTLLKILLAVFSLTSLINMLILYWIPLFIPTGSFHVERLALVSFAEKRYYLLVVSLFICVLLFLTTFSIKKNRAFLPILSLIYILCDFATVFLLFVVGLVDRFCSTTYIMQLILLGTLLVLLCKYCWRRLFINNKV